MICKFFCILMKIYKKIVMFFTYKFDSIANIFCPKARRFLRRKNFELIMFEYFLKKVGFGLDFCCLHKKLML